MEPMRFGEAAIRRERDDDGGRHLADGGVGANLAALIQEQAFDWLDAPVQRVSGAGVRMPDSKPLEEAARPGQDDVVEAVPATFGDV